MAEDRIGSTAERNPRGGKATGVVSATTAPAMGFWDTLDRSAKGLSSQES